MGKMIEVEGYKAFRGIMKVSYTILYGEVEPGECNDNIYGDWLYKPHTDCWYCGGKSYPAELCKVLEVE